MTYRIEISEDAYNRTIYSKDFPTAKDIWKNAEEHEELDKQLINLYKAFERNIYATEAYTFIIFKGSRIYIERINE